MAKNYFKSFGTTTMTTPFEADMFGRVAGVARALGIECIINSPMVDGEQRFEPMVQAVLTGPESALDECIWKLWEQWSISEDAA